MAGRLVVLEAGRIQQVGTPEAAYEHPANRFVAGFIGSPSMNFLPAALKDGVATLTDGTLLSMPGHADRDAATIGLRPETMLPVAAGLPGLVVTVDLVEPLGSDTLVHFKLAGTGYVARVPPETRPRPGDTLTLGIDLARTHLFDPVTGATIVRPS